MRFIAENFACFGDEVTFSMVASSDKKHPNHLIRKSGGEKVNLLRSAGVYGANGHGKTKLVEALGFVQRLVVDGTKPGAAIPTDPFRLAQERVTAPSRFEVAFHYRGVDYDYGFVVDHVAVREEWLFARSADEEVTLFERAASQEGGVTVEFGSALIQSADEGFLRYVATGTRPNQLFLSEAAGRNVETLLPAFAWFRDVLEVVPAAVQCETLLRRLNGEPEFMDFVSRFMRQSGSDIAKIKVYDVSNHFDSGGISELLKTYEMVSFEGGHSFVIKTIRKSEDGRDVEFYFDSESAGTKQLLNLLPFLFDACAGAKVYVIDELDRTLHPLLSYQFVDFFLNNLPEESRSQMIFTTHNTHLLDLALLRRDEVWFVEKKPNGSSALYSLADFKIRPDLDLEKGYLHGRFGAIPFLGNLKDLGWNTQRRSRKDEAC